MKKFKKLLSVFAALLMALFMPVTAFADEAPTNPGTITITNPKVDQTYSVYRMMDLESYNSVTGSYSYKVNADWATFFDEGGAGHDYITVENGYVTWKVVKDETEEQKDARVKDFVTAAELYVREKNLTPTKEATATAANTPLVINDLPLGYYLTKSTVGTVCGLDTTQPTFEITDKNTEPTNEKKILENGTPVSANDVTIGDTVNFQSTIAATKGALNYRFVDTMDQGLTLNQNDVTVTLNGTPVEAANYETKFESVNGKTVMTITFLQAFCDTLVDDDAIVISYSAVVNTNAVVNAANVNESKLVYGNNPDKYLETTPSKTKTYTWDLNVLKYGNGNTQNLLAGAKFELRKENKDGEVVKFSNVGQNEYKVDPKGTVLDFTTDATGAFNLKGLDSGNYVLVELEAPAGYNKLAAPIKVTIQAADMSVENVSYETPTAEVENKSGTELPSTGGMGTTLFYVGGAALVAGAGILLVTKKRMNKAE